MNRISKAFVAAHTAVMRLSGGRFGSQLGDNKILLLHHIGAKSGKEYASPLVYVEDDGAYAIIASAGGQPKHPGWFHNLQKNPNTTIQIRGESISVTAEVAPKARRDSLWAHIQSVHPQFEQYQSMTEREIPIVLLRPLLN